MYKKAQKTTRIDIWVYSRAIPEQQRRWLQLGVPAFKQIEHSATT